MLFHPGELYSYYGLAIRRDSPLRDTLVVGCADGSHRLPARPRAYELGEIRRWWCPRSSTSRRTADCRAGDDRRGRRPAQAGRRLTGRAEGHYNPMEVRV